MVIIHVYRRTIIGSELSKKLNISIATNTYCYTLLTHTKQRILQRYVQSNEKLYDSRILRNDIGYGPWAITSTTACVILSLRLLSACALKRLSARGTDGLGAAATGSIAREAVKYVRVSDARGSEELGGTAIWRVRSASIRYSACFLSKCWKKLLNTTMPLFFKVHRNCFRTYAAVESYRNFCAFSRCWSSNSAVQIAIHHFPRLCWQNIFPETLSNARIKKSRRFAFIMISIRSYRTTELLNGASYWKTATF